MISAASPRRIAGLRFDDNAVACASLRDDHQGLSALDISNRRPRVQQRPALRFHLIRAAPSLVASEDGPTDLGARDG
jgi:hypothetical protein